MLFSTVPLMATYKSRLAGLIAALLALTVMLAISVVWALGKWPSPTRSSTSPIAAGSSQLPLCIAPEPPPPPKLADPCPTVAPAAGVQPPVMAALAPAVPEKPEKPAAPEKPEKPEKPLKPLRPGAKVAAPPAGKETPSVAAAPAEPAPVAAPSPPPAKAPAKPSNPIDLDPYK
jgi:hypothetical protein